MHVNELHIDKSKTVPDDLSKLRNVVKYDGVRKTAYDELVTKVKVIGTSGFVSKTRYNT